MPRGTLEVLLVGAKGLEDTDFFGEIRSSRSSFLIICHCDRSCVLGFDSLFYFEYLYF